MKKVSNEFDPFLNECQTYVWEWYIPEHKVRFGIPSLNRLWIDDKSKNIKLATMLERVHPDDIEKVLVRKTSPLYRSDRMFEVDLRLNVADELLPDGAQASGKYEWYGFRGKTIRRDAKGQPTYVRGVAINLDQRYRAQMKLIAQKEHQLQSVRQQNEYCMGVMREVYSFMRGLAENANSLITSDSFSQDRFSKLNELKIQAERILSITDKYRSYIGEDEKVSNEEEEIKSLFLWEHLAELQQIYSLRASSLKIYFSNLYDDISIFVNIKLLDLLIDNIINVEQRNKVGGCVTISYSKSSYNQMHLVVTCTNALTDGGLGLSVCHILAKRLWGDVQMRRQDGDRVEYIVTLPIDARNALHDAPETDTLEELDEAETLGNVVMKQRHSLPLVLLGTDKDAGLFSDQHLFNAIVCVNTDELMASFRDNEPDMVFVESNLTGNTSLDELISSIRGLQSDVPVIVTADEASRPLHKHLRMLGAQYLLTNPLTSRKVNMMIKRYLK